MEKKIEAAMHMAGRCQGDFQDILVLSQLDASWIMRQYKIRAFYSGDAFIYSHPGHTSVILSR